MSPLSNQQIGETLHHTHSATKLMLGEMSGVFSVHSEFLNYIFCDGQYYNGMHYITLGGQLSETMTGVITERSNYKVVLLLLSHQLECSLPTSYHQLLRLYYNFIIRVSTSLQLIFIAVGEMGRQSDINKSESTTTFSFILK